jgi:hypothetical protein
VDVVVKELVRQVEEVVPVEEQLEQLVEKAQRRDVE